MTKEEAQKKCDEINLLAEQKRQFCPMIKEKCNTECVCFNRVAPRNTHPENDQTYYVIDNAGCLNAMFYGFEINP